MLDTRGSSTHRQGSDGGRSDGAADDAAPVRSALVLGIGNTLLTDDGAGIHALHLAARDDNDARTAYVDGGTVGLALAPLIEDADVLIVLDALRLDGAPGSVQVYTGAAMDALVARRCRTPHEVSLSDLMGVARLQGRLPARRALVGIEPESLDWGTEPTPRVAVGVEQAALRVRELLADWRAGGCT